MARGGVNKAIVQKAREALLARGENPSIDAVRVELGNTGSKTTIHRYLKELDEVDRHRKAPQQALSDELSELVARMAQRLTEEGEEQVVQALAASRAEKNELLEQFKASQDALGQLQQQFDIQRSALDTESAELQTCRTTLQAEQTRNARLSQSNQDLEVRLTDKEEQIRSLEEKHLHARDALEHYRTAVKDQREHEQRRHEGQLQLIQVEQRQLQQTLSVKQDELTRLNRDNERLLSDSRQQTKLLTIQDDTIARLTGELNALAIASAKEEGVKEQLFHQLAQSREESVSLRESATQANTRANNAQTLLESTQNEVEQLRHELKQLHHENDPSRSQRTLDQSQE